jgi:hypothetical protein
VAWGGHALGHQPLDFFQSNQFWPFDDTLAFSDALLGYAPAGLLGSGPHAAVFRYDLLFLFAYALAFVGPYLLARELGARRAAAVVAGVAFGYAPFRATMNGHLHVLSSGGIPLSLFLLVRGYRRRNARLVLAGWVVVAWLPSLDSVRGVMRTFPDAPSVLFLRRYRIRTVVLHTNLARAGLPPSVRNAPLPADPAAAAAEPIRGLLLRRRSLPGAVVYSVLHVPGGRAS